MELLERYLHAVRFWLPKGQQDVAAELAEDLHSQIEEREQVLGRPMSREEIGALLKKTGHPMSVAGRYAPQQPLISSALMPAFRLVIKIVLLGLLATFFVMIVLSGLFTQPSGPALAKTLWAFWSGAFMAIGITTVVFAAIERFRGPKFEQTWDPLKLPRVPVTKNIAVIPRSNSIAEVILNGAFAILWISLLTSKAIPGVHVIVLPIWSSVLPWVAALTLFGAILAVVNVFRPWRTVLKSSLRCAMNVGFGTVVIVLLRAGNWITLPFGVGHDIVRIANLSIQVTLYCALFGVTLEILHEAWLAYRATRLNPSAV